MPNYLPEKRDTVLWLWLWHSPNMSFAQVIKKKMPAENALHVGKYRNTSIRICTLYFRLSGKQKARSVMNISTNGVVC